MPNRNMYFTEEQFRKMKEHKVNWSEICQKAVDAEIARLEAERETIQRAVQIYNAHNAMVL